MTRCLQEIGYTDTILDVRSNRVQNLLGLTNQEQEDNNFQNYDEGQSKSRCKSYSINSMIRKYDFGEFIYILNDLSYYANSRE